MSIPPVQSSFILASKSPRRREILTQMGVSFTVMTKEVDESFPAGLRAEEVALYIAEKKARAFLPEMTTELLLSADTIVCLGDDIIGKPKNAADAFQILTKLAGNMHRVITAVSFLQDGHMDSFYEVTEVYFNPLSAADIRYYIEVYQPYDKAGAYGIQEWIGYVGIEKIVGSYTTVMGLPSALVYRELKARGRV